MNYDFNSSGPVMSAAQASASDRTTYIAKVYGLFFTGVFFFFASMALPIAGWTAGIPAMEAYVGLALQVGFWPALLLIIGSTFLASWLAMKPVVNLIAFYMLAAVWGFLTIPIVLYAIAVAGGGLEIVFQATALTTFVMGALTAYVFISRKDFSFMGGFLFVGLLTVIGCAIMGWFMAAVMGINTTYFQLGLSIAIVLLFSCYVLYDTSKILHHYSTDMVVPGAMSLMIDFIILFRTLLFLLASRR